MNFSRRTLRAAAVLAFGALVAGRVGGARLNPSDGEWQTFAPDDEEFSVAVPTQPSVLSRKKGYYLFYGGAWVVKRITYSGYAAGFVFVIDSYRSDTPKRLVSDVERDFRDLGRVRFQKFQTTSLGGLPARKYLNGRSTFVGHVFTVVTAKHVYTIFAASKAATNAYVDRFLSSIKFGASRNLGTVAGRTHDGNLATGPVSEPLVDAKSVDVKPIVVWKPEPRDAHPDRPWAAPSGGKVIVVLKGALTSSGEVVIWEIVKKQRDVLTEQAIEAAKHIRFFPAEHAGKPTSVRMQFEYGFNVY